MRATRSISFGPEPACAPAAAPAAAVSIGFDCLTQSDLRDSAIGESRFSITPGDPGGGSVVPTEQSAAIRSRVFGAARTGDAGTQVSAPVGRSRSIRGIREY